MKKFGFVLLFYCFWIAIRSQVVINEVFYDALGNDDDKEWIELYNNSNYDINLTGWIIQAGGSAYHDLLQLPTTTIRARSFYLISEESMTLTNLTAELGFENGGTTTDAIRIYDPRTLYTDTILYDSPNSNNLLGDVPDQEPCEGAPAGKSLARAIDGFDSNSVTDWCVAANPSPGSTNVVVKKVRLEACQYELIAEQIKVSTLIRNLSTNNVDKCELSIKVSFNNELKYYDDLNAILSEDTLNVCVIIENENFLEGNLTVELLTNTNVDIVDNLWETYIIYQAPQFHFSEIMYYPLPDNSEWVEIKFTEKVINLPLEIEDLAGGNISCVITAEVADYIVIAEQRDKVLASFVNLDSIKVYQATSWTKLNNNGDRLILRCFNSIIDTLQYSANSSPQGYSFEYQESSQEWQRCSSVDRATPTQPNSQSNDSESNYVGIKIINNLISKKQSREFILNFNSEQEVASVELILFDIRGKNIVTIYKYFPNQYCGEVTWNGVKQGKYLASGLYPLVVRVKSESGRVICEKKSLITINR